MLNLPLPTHQRQQLRWRGPLSHETAHPIDHFVAFLARLFLGPLALQLEDLGQPWPWMDACPGGTGGQRPLFDAAMAQIHGGGRLLHVAPGRLRKDQGDVRVALRLVLFDHHAIIAPLVDNRLRHAALGQKRVHRHHTACQDQRVPEGLDCRDLIGFGVNGVWRQRHAHVVGQRR